MIIFDKNTTSHEFAEKFANSIQNLTKIPEISVYFTQNFTKDNFINRLNILNLPNCAIFMYFCNFRNY